MGWTNNDNHYSGDDEAEEGSEAGESEAGRHGRVEDSIASSELFRDCFEAQMVWLRMCGLDTWINLPKMRWDSRGLQCYDQTVMSVRFEEECVNDPLCLPVELEGKCPHDLVLGSVYGVMVQQYLLQFSHASVHVVPLEDLLREPQKTMDTVTAFLDIEQETLSSTSLGVVEEYRNHFRSRPRLRASTRVVLKEYFMPFVRSLEVLLRVPRGILWG